MQRWVGVLLGLVALAAGVGALWTYLSDGAGDTVLVLAEVDGRVELSRGEARIETVEVGQELEAADEIRTGEDARAVLGLGASRIRLGPEANLRVRSVSADGGVSLEMQGGALEATVRPGNGPVRIGNGGREVVATNAEFALAVDEGVLQVEAREGELGISGADDITRLEAGSSATILGRKAAVAPIPEELLLEVSWPPGGQRTRAEREVISGTTQPGVEVTVHGASGAWIGRADEQGRFAIDVPLDEGRNEVRVTAVDPLGHAFEVKGFLQTRDTLGPRSKSGVQYGP